MSLLLDEGIHLLIALLIAFLLSGRSRDWQIYLSAFIVGILPDVDHWFDYFLYFGPQISLVKFFSIGKYIDLAGKIYLPFHGIELALPLCLIGKWLEKKLKIKHLGKVLPLVYLGHLSWDYFTAKPALLGYSLIYRLLTDFDLDCFHRPGCWW